MIGAGSPMRLQRPQRSGVLAMAAAAALIAWLVSANGHHAPLVKPVAPVPVTRSASAPAVPRPASRRHGGSLLIKPVVLTEADLRTRARALGQVAYWVGPAPGRRYELSRSSSGEVVVRYLPAGVGAGASSQAVVTVATTPFPDAFATAETSIRGRGIRWVRIAKGGLASYLAKQPELVFVTYPGLPFRIALFDPVAAEARALAVSGKVQPVG